MSSQLQLGYLDAVLCMMELPSTTPFNGTKSRSDDFQALHVALTYGIHWVVGYFVPYILVYCIIIILLRPISALSPRIPSFLREDIAGRLRLQWCAAVLELVLRRR